MFTACSELADETEYPSLSSTIGIENGMESRIKATVTLSETDRLDAKLGEALNPEQKYLIQDLTIKGTFYGVDVNTLHKLRQLESLDMSEAILSGASQTYYEFQEPFDYDNGSDAVNTYRGDLSDNCLTKYFFCGMHTLSSIKLPSSIIQIGDAALSGTSIPDIVIPSSVTKLEGDVFNHCKQLKVLIIPSSINSVGGIYGWMSFLNGCQNLINVVWRSSATIKINRPNINCILHLEGDGLNSAFYDESYQSSWQRVARDNQLDELVLSYTDYSWIAVEKPYRNSYNYVAKHASLSMNFHYRETPIDQSSAGWRTIVIPFDVDTIISEEKGPIAPFGSNVEGAKPFWLRELTKDGYVDATSIKANKPYIMALPNNPNYIDDYNISGMIYFKSENATIPAVPDSLPAVAGPDYDLQPTYQYVKHSRDVYALNYNYEIFNVPFGSVFAHMSADVFPFEAYARLKSDAVLTEIGSVFTVMPSLSTRTITHNGIKRVPLPDDI